MIRINAENPTEKSLLEVLSSRDLLLGVTPFTSAFLNDGIITFWDYHKERLQKSFEFLYPSESWSSMEENLKKMKNSVSKNGSYYLRLTMIRTEKSVQLLSHEISYEHEETEILLKTKKHPKRVSTLPVFLKNGEYLETFKHVEESKKEGFTDCLFLDEEGNAAEASTSNIFFRKGNRFFSPPVVGPVLDGITRKIVCEILKEKNFNFEELAPSRGEWESMDEVFITNALVGIQNVKRIDSREFEVGSEFINEINEKFKEKMNE